MVDSVYFNPFTGKVLTAEEIQKLDENRDGIVSSDELNKNMSWLAPEQDTEGEVQIDETSENNNPAQSHQLDDRGNDIYNEALNNGAQSSADNREELEQYLTEIESRYIQRVLDESNMQGTAEESGIITYLKNQKTEFLNEYFQAHPKGPYDMEEVAASYIKTMDTAFAQRQQDAEKFSQSIENMKDSSANFENLFSAANIAGDDMDAEKFQALKDQTVDYILGQMMNGEIDEDFLSAINPKFQDNINYINAANAIKTMQNQSDPAKKQEYLEKAKEEIAKLIGMQNVDGSSALVNAINSK